MQKLNDKGMESNFNVVINTWVRVITTAGKHATLTVPEVFQQAGQIRDLDYSNPMDRLAVTRFLISLLYWSEGAQDRKASDSTQTLLGKDFFANVGEFLSMKAVLFNLFGEEKRFLQIRGGIIGDYRWLISELKDNYWSSEAISATPTGLCASCALLGILRLPLFALGGLGPGKCNLTTGVNATPPIYSLPVGHTLQETLTRNYAAISAVGVPAWEQNPSGFLGGMTCIPRLLWLVQPTAVGRCVQCNEQRPLIRECFYGADRLPIEDWNDPHVLYSETGKAPMVGNPTKDISRGDKYIYGLLNRYYTEYAQEEEGDAQGYLVVGFASNQAKNIDVWERKITIGPKKNGVAAVKSLPPRLELVHKFGRKKETPQVLRSLRQTLTPACEETVSGLIGSRTASEIIEEVQEAYRPALAHIAQTTTPGFTVADTQIRHEIETFDLVKK